MKAGILNSKCQEAVGTILVAIFLFAFFYAQPVGAIAGTSTGVSDEHQLKVNGITWKSDVAGQVIYTSALNTSVSNCSANIILTGMGDGYVSFKVAVHYSNITLQKEADHVEAIWDWVSFNGTESNNSRVLTDVTMNSVSDEFFCSVSFLSAGSKSAGWSGAAEIQIAFSVDPYYQFDLGGITNNPIPMGYHRQRLAASDTNLTTSKGFLTASNSFSWNDLRVVSSDSPQGRINILTHEQAIHTSTRIVTMVQNGSPQITAGLSENNVVASGSSVLGIVHPTFYGLVHDVFWYEYDSAPQQVPSWWLQGTRIQQAVYVRSPSKARILSDLQYYNMYYDYSESASRELWAYELDTEGYGPAPPSFWGGDYAVVTSADVKAIWGTWGDHNSYPRGTVILADYCESLLLGPAYYNQMARAFVDYGASSYVGNQIFGAPVVMDPFTTTFWQSICFQEQTVGQANNNAQTSEYNYLMSQVPPDPGGTAIYFQLHVAFGIYGSTSKTIL